MREMILKEERRETGSIVVLLHQLVVVGTAKPNLLLAHSA